MKRSIVTGLVGLLMGAGLGVGLTQESNTCPEDAGLFWSSNDKHDICLTLDDINPTLPDDIDSLLDR